MLGAAHVLAMDAKNLLDVVDKVRMRYPQVDEMIRNNRVEDKSTPPSAGADAKDGAVSCPPSTSEVAPHYGLPKKMPEHITAS